MATQGQLAYVATILAGTGANQSTDLTATINVTAEFKARVPFQVEFANVSADPIVKVFRSTDGGNNFDTDALTSFAIGRVAGGTGRRSFTFNQGMYAVQMTTSGPQTQTFQILTQEILTAYHSV